MNRDEFIKKLVDEEEVEENLEYWAEEYLHAYEQLTKINEIEAENERLKRLLRKSIKRHQWFVNNQINIGSWSYVESLKKFIRNLKQALKGE